MNKPFALFAVALLAGAGWLALHPAGSRGSRHPEPLAEPTATAADTGARQAPSELPSSMAGNNAALPTHTRAGAPLAFDYASASPQPDGSFAIEWNFDVTSGLHPGDTVQVRLPFAIAPYTAVVQDEAISDGTRRITGRLQDDHGVDSWPFSVTLSSDRKYATANFNTGATQFTVEADPRSGRLKDTADEAARLDDDAVQ